MLQLLKASVLAKQEDDAEWGDKSDPKCKYKQLRSFFIQQFKFTKTKQ